MRYLMIVIALAAILLLTVVIRALLKKRAKQKQMSVLAEDKMREESLDRIILNENTVGQKEIFAAPLEVRYDAGNMEKKAGKKKGKPHKTMVQIVENSELSARKYMFDPQDKIYIGSKAGKNHIVVTDSAVDGCQCTIIESAGKVYVHNTGRSGKVILKRGKQRAYIEQKYIELRSGDCIILGNTVFRIDLIETNEK